MKRGLLPAVAVLTIVLLGIDSTNTSIAQEAATREQVNPAPGMPKQDVAGYRKHIKDAMQGHLKAFGLILTFRAPFEKHFALHAEALENLSTVHASLYPEGSQSDTSRATIWEEPEAFAAAMERSTKAANRLRETVESNNRHAMLNGFSRLVESCEGCHGRYRSGD